VLERSEAHFSLYPLVFKGVFSEKNVCHQSFGLLEANLCSVIALFLSFCPLKRMGRVGNGVCGWVWISWSNIFLEGQLAYDFVESSAKGSSNRHQVCDALRCSGLHAHYNEKDNRFKHQSYMSGELTLRLSLDILVIILLL